MEEQATCTVDVLASLDRTFGDAWHWPPRKLHLGLLFSTPTAHRKDRTY
jgi:hypothetical protein